MGEASHPGPPQQASPDGLQIGCINPTGLLGKSGLIAEMPRRKEAIWAVSETHLTNQGRRKCTAELWHHRTGYHLHAGAPVPARSASVSAIGGKHRGVAFLTTMPTRNMSSTWPQSAWEEARFHVSCFCLGRRWIQGAVIYGHAVSPETNATKDATNQICRLVTDRLVHQSTGLRFIAGDFNQNHLALESMELWASLGWVNVQWWAFQKFQRAIAPTCKGVSTRDHIFVSPELAVYLQSVFTDDSFFKDHAILAATVQNLSRPPLLPMWRQPRPIDWSQVQSIKTEAVEPQGMEDPSSSKETTMEDKYSQIFSTMEARVDAKLDQTHKLRLLPSQKGRATTFEIQWIQEHSQPPKPGRQGDRQPKFHGVDPTHCRWLRQVRRLRNLVKLLQKQVLQPSQLNHASNLWHSIAQAPGFQHGFLGWWNENHGKRATLSDHIPSLTTASIVADVFENLLDQYETVLVQTRVSEAKQRRKDNTNLIFKDLRRESPQPCTSLLHTARSVIQECDLQTMSIVVDPPQPWKSDRPVWTSEGPLAIIHAEPDQLWVEAIPASDNLVGTAVHQDDYVGDIQMMFQAFQKEWSTRWDKHIGVDDSFWQPLVDFASTVFPEVPKMPYEPITIDQWKSALRSRKTRSAVGTDGVSKEDLLNMPDTLTQALLQILLEVEQGKPWPAQMMQGWIVALAKQPDSCTVGQYRPITIFVQAYRLWSSIRSKQVIRHLSRLAPPSCAGNLPHKSTCDVWYSILTSIELAHHTNQEASGAVIDLIKCFNLIPRMPILMFMRIFQVAEPILLAWGSALVSMRRRFKLRNCTGPGIPSTTGYAEGCGMSVTAMLAVNLVAHKWISLRVAATTLYSFVDNLEILSCSAERAIQGLEELLNFTRVLDVPVDHQKTYLWSTQPRGRKLFRQTPHLAGQYKILHKARDLGGHMAYTKQHTNSTITKRLEAMPDLWNQLARSVAPYSQKLRALKAKAWPLGLHGVAAATMADGFFTTLRTGAMRGLKSHSNGTNPMVHLGAVEHPTHDPQYHAILATVLMLRSHGPAPEVFEYIMDAHHVGLACKPPPGPNGVVLHRLHCLGWRWITKSLFLDQDDLPIDIMHCPVQELRIRLAENWQQHVMRIAQARKTFAGAPYMHPGLTTTQMKRHEAEQQALLRTALNGTFFTADHLVHRNEEHDGRCRFCQQPDSQIHRHWKCPFFASCRSHLTQDQIAIILELPTIVATHGWIPIPPSLPKFRKLCLEIPDETWQFEQSTTPDNDIHLFTDGGCLAPTSPHCRLASWGVVRGSISDDRFVPLANGLLPGWVQTAARAEVMAVIAALEYITRLRKPFILWVDNDRVYKKLCLFQKGQQRIASNHKDADLWFRLRALFCQVGQLMQYVGKVVSHQDLSKAGDEAERWICQGNAAADRTAASAYQKFPILIQAWEELYRDIAQVCIMRDQIHRVLISVGQKSFQQPMPRKADKQLPARISQEDVHEFMPHTLDIQGLAKRWIFPEVEQVASWLLSIVDPQAKPKPYSWFQLNKLFEFQTALPGIGYQPSKKKYFILSKGTSKDFVRRSNHFSRWIQGTYKCKVLHLRPFSSVISFWTMCVAMRVKPFLAELMDELLRDHQPVYTQVRQLCAVS